MFDKEPYYTEKIEAYLRNELNESEKAQFEQLLRQDPLLYNEFKLQQEIIGSIQAHRKQQLKQRLERIDVSDLMKAGPNPAAIAGLFLSGAVLLGIIGWFSFGDAIRPTGKQTEQTAVVSQLPASGNDKARAVKPFEREAEPVETEDVVTPSVPEKTVAPAAAKQVPAPSNISKAPIAQANAQAEEKPLTEETPRKTVFAEDNAGKTVAITKEAEAAPRLHIVDNTNAKLKLHYYFLNNQVALLGFDKPYVLLEIQPENTTYLFYDGNFYQLNTTKAQPSPITEVLVTDPQLIEKLNERLNNRE
jgi:cytoskeletal protein RodZ